MDPRELDLNPAAVWVQPREISTTARPCGCGCYLIVSTARPATALRCWTTPWPACSTCRPVPEDDVFDLSTALVLPSGPTPLPAYRVAVDLDL